MYIENKCRDIVNVSDVCLLNVLFWFVLKKSTRNL